MHRVDPKPIAPNPLFQQKKMATAPARSYDSELAGEYAVTVTALYSQDSAGTDASVLVLIPKGVSVHYYGYYALTDGVKRLCVQVDFSGARYTVFADSEYLERK